MRSTNVLYSDTQREEMNLFSTGLEELRSYVRRDDDGSQPDASVPSAQDTRQEKTSSIMFVRITSVDHPPTKN